VRAVLTNFGTTGDIQPFLALATELRRAGHKPILALSPTFSSRAAELDFEFVPIGPDLQKVQTEIIATMLELVVANSVEKLRALFEPLAQALPRTFEDLKAACHGADVLISGPLQPASRMVHEVTGIPFVSVQIAHFGGRGRPALQQATASFINPFRTCLGLQPLQNPLSLDANSKQLSLYAISRHVFKTPKDWPASDYLTGYFFFDDNKWRPPQELLKFIEASEPPILITLGSTTYENTGKLSNVILEAIQWSNQRAIIQHGWSGLATGTNHNPNIYTLGPAPHHWLFPQVSCIVHHGGAGTAAAAFRAGIPSIFILHGAPIHSTMAQELGCAGPPISYWDLTAERLAAAIDQTLNTPAYYEAAAMLGERIRLEAGVKKARQLIERLVDNHG
jgi:sterol 3beta-glucosyltransferase